MRMNKYSFILIVLSFISIIGSEFIDERLSTIGFGLLVLAFLLPMIVTKATGQEFKGN